MKQSRLILYLFQLIELYVGLCNFVTVTWSATHKELFQSIEFTMKFRTPLSACVQTVRDRHIC